MIRTVAKARSLPASSFPGYKDNASDMQVDLRNPLTLVSYFASPRWEAALQRMKVELSPAQ